MKKIAIFCGGPSSEYEISLSSAKSILNHIDKKKYIPFIFYIKKNLSSTYYKAGKEIDTPKNAKFDSFEKVLKKNKNYFDIAFLGALHGEFGEDGTIQLLLENLGIKYTGSNSKSSSLCIDKFQSMENVKKIKEIETPKTVFLNLNDLESTPPLKFPFIIKPNTLGSSVLVFRVGNKKDYTHAISEIKKAHAEEILIQELIEGIELSCGCLETKRGKFLELPPIEITPKASFFDYESKYEIGGSEEIAPPISISKKESDRISKLTIKIHKLLKCKTYSRSDFIYNNGKVYFLETNTQPGMTSTSLLPKEAKAAGISFIKLIDFMIEESL